MTLADIVQISTDLLLTAVILALPPVLVSLLVGISISILQTMTSIQEQTLTFLPRMLLTLLMVVFTGHWLIKTLLTWFSNLAQIIPGVFG